MRINGCAIGSQTMKQLLSFFILGLLSQSSLAAINILACEPEWAALATALGKESVKVHSATTYQQDPHHIQARPSLIAKARKADLLICSGAGLEEGWLPLLIRKSNNTKIQAGNTGYFIATEHVSLLGKTMNVDRSEGDVHGLGNPHIHMHPDYMLQVASALSSTLSQIEPDKKADFAKNLVEFTAGIQQMKNRLQSKIDTLQGKQLIVHHDSWVYLCEWLGLEKVATLEPKSGLPPSTSHLSGLLKQFKDKPAYSIIYSSYQDGKPAEWLSKRSNTPAIMLPYSVDDWKQSGSLASYYESLINSLLKAGEK